MQVNPVSIINSEKGKEKLKTIGAPAVLASGAAFIASKNAGDSVKLTTRLGKAGKAGLVAAGVMALLTLSKEEAASAAQKTKGFVLEQAAKIKGMKDGLKRPKLEEGVATCREPECQGAAPLSENTFMTFKK